MTDANKQLGRDIGEFFRNQRTGNANQPVVKPADIDDGECDPRLRERAGQWYAAELLKQKTLTPNEAKYLQSEIAKYAREQQQTR